MSRQGVLVGLVVLTLVLAPGWLGAQKPAAGPEKSFDGDLCADLAIGTPGYDDPTYGVDVGAASVLYGTSPGGLAFADNQTWCLWVPGMTETPQPIDIYGWSVAVGNFTNNGYADLVVGIPGKDLDPTLVDAGAVHAVFGTADGLVAPGYQVLTAGDQVQAGAQLGYALAGGDFDGDGDDDLAVSAPYEDSDWGTVDSGSVYLFEGWTWGGAFYPDYWGLIEQGGAVPGAEEADDRLGTSLAAGDFNGDGFDDLVIGVPLEDVASAPDAGVFHVVYGTDWAFPWDSANQLWSEDLITGGVIETGNMFGYALAAGDFDGDGYDDLAVSAPGKKVTWLMVDQLRAGVVYVLRGSPSGLTDQGSHTWHQPDVGYEPESDDLFGFALAAGDLDGDRYADLAIGVPYEDLGSPDPVNAGCVHVLYGSATGLVEDIQMWTQNTGSIQGVAEANDWFGLSLAVGDFDADGYGDLVVGAPGEIVGTTSSGAIHVLSGTQAGLTDVGNQLWYQETASWWATGGGFFGLSLAAEPKSRAFIFADDFECGGPWAWSTGVWLGSTARP